MRLAVQFCTPPRGGSEPQRLERSARSGSPHVAAALTLARPGGLRLRWLGAPRSRERKTSRGLHLRCQASWTDAGQVHEQGEFCKDTPSPPHPQRNKRCISAYSPPRARFCLLVQTYSGARDTTQKEGGRSRSRRGQRGGMLWGWAQGAGARMGGVSWTDMFGAMTLAMPFAPAHPTRAPARLPSPPPP